MTKKDYIIIARVLNYHSATPSSIERNIIKQIVESLSKEFIKDNPRFIASKFISACGITLEF